MTVQEVKKAIRHFECMKNDAVVVLDSGFGTHKGESDLVYRNRKMYAELAIEALEKQIPKKPLKYKGAIYSVDKEGNADYEVCLVCPTCKKEVLVPKFPCHCGQLIDWKDIGKLEWEEGGTSD